MSLPKVLQREKGKKTEHCCSFSPFVSSPNITKKLPLESVCFHVFASDCGVHLPHRHQSAQCSQLTHSGRPADARKQQARASAAPARRRTSSPSSTSSPAWPARSWGVSWRRCAVDTARRFGTFGAAVCDAAVTASSRPRHGLGGLVMASSHVTAVL